jgi:hypothetical protein
MTHKSHFVAAVGSFCFLFASLAQTQTSGPIPSTRVVDWTHVGVPGGIPSANWPIAATLSPRGGGLDDSVAIQNAIDAAPANSVVVLNAGTFTLKPGTNICHNRSDDGGGGVYEAGLCLDKSVVLRGQGPQSTTINYGAGANIISLGKTYLCGTCASFVNITSPATKGSTQITLASVSGVSSGTYLVVTQHNPLDSDGNALVDNVGYTGSCSNCGHGYPNNVMTQVDKVTNVTGSVVTLEQPLYFDYNTSPQIYKLPNMVEHVGLENLKLVGTASSGTGIVYKNINVESCAYCWVHGVESDMAVDRANLYYSDVYASEFSDNFLNDGFSHNSGEDYAVFLEYRASANLVQNNIIRKARHSAALSGGSGNVFAYNYMIDPYMGEDPNYLPDGRTHGAHPYMNLWEGNVQPQFEQDHTHGSTSHNTFFRNYYNLTSTNPSTGLPMANGHYGVNIAAYSNYTSVIGNVIGQYPSGCGASVYQINGEDTESPAIYKLGYWGDGGETGGSPTLNAKAETTMIRGGNWDCVTNSVIWNTNVPSGSLASTYLTPESLPNSLYLSGKPSWFAATSAVWPPIDPSASTKVNKIPAQLCYENGPKTRAPFNPSSCYLAVSSTAPQPPTNLTATVN